MYTTYANIFLIDKWNRIVGNSNTNRPDGQIAIISNRMVKCSTGFVEISNAATFTHKKASFPRAKHISEKRNPIVNF
jgi:hypothetical protein